MELTQEQKDAVVATVAPVLNSAPAPVMPSAEHPVVSQLVDGPRVVGGSAATKITWQTFARAVHNSEWGRGKDKINASDWLQNAVYNTLTATAVNVESSGAAGGYAVPTILWNQVVPLVQHTLDLLDECVPFTTTANNLSIDVDSLGPWSTSSIQAYWGAENAPPTQSAHVVDQVQMKLNPLFLLTGISRFLEGDNTVDYSGYINRKIADVFGYNVDYALIRSSGINQPQGLMNSGSVLATGGGTAFARSVALSLAMSDILAMRVAFFQNYAKFGKPHWFIDMSLYSAITSLVLGSYQSAVLSIGGYTNQDGVEKLAGFPIEWTTSLQPTAGTTGDIILADMATIGCLRKTTGYEQYSALEWAFSQFVRSTLGIYRLDTRSLLKQVITLKDGTTTRSNIVTLATKLT